MNKIEFICELCTLPDEDDFNVNFDKCMAHSQRINLFYDVLQSLAEEYGLRGKIAICPQCFSFAEEPVSIVFQAKDGADVPDNPDYISTRNPRIKPSSVQISHVAPDFIKITIN